MQSLAKKQQRVAKMHAIRTQCNERLSYCIKEALDSQLLTFATKVRLRAL